MCVYIYIIYIYIYIYIKEKYSTVLDHLGSWKLYKAIRMSTYSIRSMGLGFTALDGSQQFS